MTVLKIRVPKPSEPQYEEKEIQLPAFRKSGEEFVMIEERDKYTRINLRPDLGVFSVSKLSGIEVDVFFTDKWHESTQEEFAKALADVLAPLKLDLMYLDGTMQRMESLREDL